MLYHKVHCIIMFPALYTVTHNDILYTGMMYHEKKEVGHWKAIYSVVKDLDVLKKVIMQSS